MPGRWPRPIRNPPSRSSHGGGVVPARREAGGGGHDDGLLAHRLVLAEAHRHPTIGRGYKEEAAEAMFDLVSSRCFSGKVE